MKKREQLVIPVFIPHEGCPYRCSFCNQSKITGVHIQSDEMVVNKAIKVVGDAIKTLAVWDFSTTWRRFV